MQQTKIGQYELKDELGSGGMGRVYRAFDLQHNREVALKVINLNAVRRFPLEEQEEVLKRFYHEVQMIAKLQHIAIVPLFDSGDDNGLPYMVMPLMGGGSLEMRLSDKQGNPQPLPFTEIERIFRWITPALDKMHAQKIVHRDLKPANILFDDDDHPYIADFGIAKITEGSITFNTGIIGTPAYMSPEQIDGQKEVDARSDVYSLGSILYQMLTGKYPYHNAHPVLLPALHLNEPPPELDEVRADLSPDWQVIINKAMAKNPEVRYQTAGELSADITFLLRDKNKHVLALDENPIHEIALPEPENPVGEITSSEPENPVGEITSSEPEKPVGEIALSEPENESKDAILPPEYSLSLKSTLVCFLFFLPTFALGLDMLPRSTNAFSATTYFWISGGWVIVWLSTGFFEEIDEDETHNAVDENDTYNAVDENDTHNEIDVYEKHDTHSTVSVMGFAATFALAFVMSLILEAEAGGLVVESVANVVVTVVAGFIIALVAEGVTFGTTGGMAGMIVLFITLVMVFFTLGIKYSVGLFIVCCLAFSVEVLSKKSLKSKRLSYFLTLGTSTTLALTYVFLIWYLFLEGWQMFI